MSTIFGISGAVYEILRVPARESKSGKLEFILKAAEQIGARSPRGLSDVRLCALARVIPE